MDPIFNAIQQNLNSALSIPFVSSAVTLGLAFYAYKAGPELPSFMEELFLNVFFQVFVGFMVLYMTTGNFMLSLVVSVVFIYGMKMLSGLKEGMFGGDADSYIKFMNKDFSDKLAEKLRQNNSSLKNVSMDNAKNIMVLVQEVMKENNYGDLPEITQEKADELNIPNKIQVALKKVFGSNIAKQYEKYFRQTINFEYNYTDSFSLPNAIHDEDEEMVPLDEFDIINSNRNYADPNNMTPEGRIYGSQSNNRNNFDFGISDDINPPFIDDQFNQLE